MPVSADTLRLLMDAGMTGDELLAVVESIDADHKAKRSSGAERQARYRERNQSKTVISDVTSDASHCDGEQKGPFDKETPPVPPKEINISKKTPPIVPPGFEEFWELYRVKKGRKTAIKAFSQAIKSVDLQAMLDAVNRYQAVTDPKFQLHPTTWLNQERWTDDHSQLATGPPASQFQSHAAKMREEAAAKEAQANGQSH